MTIARRQEAYRQKVITIVAAIAFAVLVISIVVFMNIKNTMDLQAILMDSVKSQLISTSIAAREIIDVDAFISYNNAKDAEADGENYGRMLSQLRTLADNVGAKYIYALKRIGDQYYFIFDSDPAETNAAFMAYELAPVHIEAFRGINSAGIMNLDDEFGSFNTAAVPIWKDGQVVGIISTDIEDTFLKQSGITARNNSILLITTLVTTMLVMLGVVFLLFRRIKQMQDRLENMAHYDAVTGLPNRQYLLENLAQVTQSKSPTPFALLFIDLDNFKKVNDNAGHDAGDELLRSIAQYLNTVPKAAKVFRPAPGILNIAARIGGDEFVQIVPNVSTVEEAGRVAQKLLEGFESQVRIHNRYVEKYAVGLSVGVALYPYHTDNYHVLIKYADIAMYHAKNAGKNRHCIYDDGMAPSRDR